MSRHWPGGRLVIASHNPDKVREITDLLRPFPVTVVAASALELPEPEETGDSFAANATLKARAAAEATGLPALADDSGVDVAALGGDPGIYSARWAGPDKDFALAMTRVERALAEASDDMGRRARFVSVLALAWPDGNCDLFEGIVHGRLVWPPRGDGGFGYDPMFLPDGCALTFGEMAADAKHAISHRARAFAALVADVFAAAPADRDRGVP